MQSIQVDLEILYVQKIYFFMFLMTLTLLSFAVTIWAFGIKVALIVLIIGLITSYIAMIKKQSFSPPEKKLLHNEWLVLLPKTPAQYPYLVLPASSITIFINHLRQFHCWKNSSHLMILYSVLPYAIFFLKKENPPKPSISSEITPIRF